MRPKFNLVTQAAFAGTKVPVRFVGTVVYSCVDYDVYLSIDGSFWGYKNTRLITRASPHPNGIFWKKCKLLLDAARDPSVSPNARAQI